MYLRWVAKTVTLFLALGLAYMAAPDRADAVQVKGDPQFQAWADQSLVATPSFRVFARNRSCPFIIPPPGMVAACAKRFTVWVQLGFGGSHWRFMHELGHVIHRQVFGGRWLTPEVFAERFAGCAIYRMDEWCDRVSARVSERPAFGGVR